MAKVLLKLRGVPEDELEEVQALLDEHGIDYYETSAGNWGISMPALWLSDDAQYERARALLDDYARRRFERARGEYEELRRTGRQRTLRDIFRENPSRFLLYIVLIAGLLWLSIVPFVSVAV